MSEKLSRPEAPNRIRAKENEKRAKTLQEKCHIKSDLALQIATLFEHPSRPGLLRDMTRTLTKTTSTGFNQLIQELLERHITPDQIASHIQILKCPFDIKQEMKGTVKDRSDGDTEGDERSMFLTAQRDAVNFLQRFGIKNMRGMCFEGADLSYLDLTDILVDNSTQFEGALIDYQQPFIVICDGREIDLKKDILQFQEISGMSVSARYALPNETERQRIHADILNANDTHTHMVVTYGEKPLFDFNWIFEDRPVRQIGHVTRGTPVNVLSGLKGPGVVTMGGRITLHGGRNLQARRTVIDTDGRIVVTRGASYEPNLVPFTDKLKERISEAYEKSLTGRINLTAKLEELLESYHEQKLRFIRVLY